MAIDIRNIVNLRCEQDTWIDGYVSCQIGGRPENQDSWGKADTKAGTLFVVCDGMGGGPSGATASRLAVDNILDAIKNGDPTEKPADLVVNAIKRANDAIIEFANNDPRFQGMGTTCTVLLITQHSAIAAYVGDSRIYQVRGDKKVWRTFDHSMVFGLVKQGVITEEQARLSAQSNVITRALGVKPDVEVDVTELPFLKRDRFVLTTDGVHGSMPEKDLLKYLSTKKTNVYELVENLSFNVDNLGIGNGNHHDNNTVMVVDVKKNSKLKIKMSAKTKLLIAVLCILLAASLALNIVQCSQAKAESEPAQTTIVDDATEADGTQADEPKEQQEADDNAADNANSETAATNDAK